MNESDKKTRSRNEQDVYETINEHPLHSEQIANKLQICVGEVNAAVLSLRSRGIPICGDDSYDGYYYGCPAELKRTISQLEWQHKLLEVSIGLLKRSLEEQEEKNDEEAARRSGRAY